MERFEDIIKSTSYSRCLQLRNQCISKLNLLKQMEDKLVIMKGRIKLNIKALNGILQSLQTVNARDNQAEEQAQFQQIINEGNKIFIKFAQQIKLPLNSYKNLKGKTKRLIEKIKANHDIIYHKNDQYTRQFQSQVEKYMLKCYPETSSIFYILGINNCSKMPMVYDALYEQQFTSNCKQYEKMVSLLLSQTQKLITLGYELAQQYHHGSQIDWSIFFITLTNFISQSQLTRYSSSLVHSDLKQQDHI